MFFFFSSRRRHTRYWRDWSSDVCSSDLFYGSRKMVEALRAEGRLVNRKRVRRLTRLMGLVALAPKPGTSKASPQNKIYPYLLRGLTIEQPNHVWAADITYIPMAKGFLYLVAIIDWASRAVLAWRLSNTMRSEERRV